MKKYWENAKKTGKVREIHQSKKVGTMIIVNDYGFKGPNKLSENDLLSEVEQSRSDWHKVMTNSSKYSRKKTGKII